MDNKTARLIKKLHKRGVKVPKIMELLNITKYKVYSIISPERHQRELERNRSWCKRKRKDSWKNKKQIWLDKMATVPPDNRTPMQVLMGEPIYERSALYQREQEPWKPKSVAIPIEKGAGE